MKVKILFFLSILFCSTTLFAKQFPINLNFVNNTSASWQPILYDLDHMGPVIDSNGGKRQWLVSWDIDNIFPNLFISYPERGGYIIPCLTEKGDQLALSIAKYTGDAINITVTNDDKSPVLVRCYCTGSAC